MAEAVRVRDADLGDAADLDTLHAILDAYARGPGGQNAPLAEGTRAALGPGLRAAPNAFVLFGEQAGRVVGAAVCFWGFSTFAGRPSVNLHDFSVLPQAQGQGVGTALLTELERRARERGCAKLTLEVHASNEGARRLYARFGFEGWDPPTHFVAKPL